jgi:triacylglycerol lipase
MQSIIAAVLAFVQGFAGFFGIAVCSANAEPVAHKDPYPIVFVHGAGGWGEGTPMNSIMPGWGSKEYLASEGYEVYAPSVGPFSSVWDRSCEMYAQITGTRVDYGEAHSKEHGHDRYGEKHKHPLIEGWSTERKIYLLGHSWGGPTVRQFAQLCEAGSKAERDANQKNISPLFTGELKGRIAAVVALAADHNGVIEPPMDFLDLRTIEAAMLAASVVLPVMDYVYPFRLGHFGLTTWDLVKRPVSTIKSLIDMQENADTAMQGTLVDGMTQLNKTIQCQKGIYYFSYAIRATQEDENGKLVMMDSVSSMMKSFGNALCNLDVPYTTPGGTVIDKTWLVNDGMVPLVSARYPFTEPHKDYNPKKIEKGIWQVMPLITSGWDHATFATDTPEVKAFYLNLAEMLAALPKG